MSPNSDVSQSFWLQALSGALDGGVLLLAPDRTPEFANPAALELLGCATLEELLPRWPEILKRIEQAAPRGLGASERVVVDGEVAADGKKRWLRWQFMHPSVDSCEAWVVLLRDLEVVRTLEKELRLAARFLCFSRLYRATSHDLRDPLNAITLHLELLSQQLRDEQRLPASDLDSLGTIEREFHRFNLAFQLFLRQSQPPQDVHDTFDCGEMMQEVAALLAPLARERHIDMTIESPGTAMPFSGVGSQIKEAIVLVAINGVDAMPDGGRLTLRVETARGRIRILVTDTGTGIRPAAISRIWDLHHSTKKDATGLGLHVARSIVEDQGGTLTVVQTSPRGTTLAIELPASNTRT